METRIYRCFKCRAEMEDLGDGRFRCLKCGGTVVGSIAKVEVANGHGEESCNPDA